MPDGHTPTSAIIYHSGMKVAQVGSEQYMGLSVDHSIHLDTHLCRKSSWSKFLTTLGSTTRLQQDGG